MKMNALIFLVFFASAAAAQDIRGMEACMAEKQMERRTGCLQANAEFLQQELAKLKRETNGKMAATASELAAAKAEIAGLKAAVAKLDGEISKSRDKK
jgi:septal ring factor EnvC (AmiA/AmiB activator)